MKKLIVLTIAVLLMLGCAGMRKGFISVSEEDIKNRDAMIIASQNFLETWGFNSGAIRAGLGSSISKMPQEAIDAMDDLDVLYLKFQGKLPADYQYEFKYLPKLMLGQGNELSDAEFGYALWVRVRMAGEVIKEALKKYAPDVFEYIAAAVM